MTAPFFLVEPGTLRTAPGDLVVVEGPEGRHAVTVRRLTPGERVLVGDGEGHLVEGVVAAVPAPDRLEVRVESYAEIPAAAPRVVVVQALAKGDRAELSVEMLTEVGVDVLVPWQAGRSVAQWRGEKVARGVERWRTTAREAGKQSRRPWLPQVEALATTADVVRRITETVGSGGSAVVLHEAASLRMASMRLPQTGDVLLVVGPEGGIADDERAAFEAAGALSARLGPSVLRTSTAGTVAAAVVLASCGRWD